MAKTAKWYSGGFILVTVAESRDGYQHPRISVCRLYEGTDASRRHMNYPALPSVDVARKEHPTRDAETLLTFEFQQNFADKEPGEAWLTISARETSYAYGGHLDAPSIRVERGGVEISTVTKRLNDVDRALKSFREALHKVGAPAPRCDASNLMLALKHAFKLDVLFVVHARGTTTVQINPSITDDTAARVAWQVEQDQRERASAH